MASKLIRYGLWDWGAGGRGGLTLSLNEFHGPMQRNIFQLEQSSTAKIRDLLSNVKMGGDLCFKWGRGYRGTPCTQFSIKVLV